MATPTSNIGRASCYCSLWLAGALQGFLAGSDVWGGGNLICCRLGGQQGQLIARVTLTMSVTCPCNRWPFLLRNALLRCLPTLTSASFSYCSVGPTAVERRSGKSKYFDSSPVPLLENVGREDGEELGWAEGQSKDAEESRSSHSFVAHLASPLAFSLGFFFFPRLLGDSEFGTQLGELCCSCCTGKLLASKEQFGLLVLISSKETLPSSISYPSALCIWKTAWVWCLVDPWKIHYLNLQFIFENHLNVVGRVKLTPLVPFS